MEASRFAAHLSECMNLGRRSARARVAVSRFALNSTSAVEKEKISGEGIPIRDFNILS